MKTYFAFSFIIILFLTSCSNNANKGIFKSNFTIQRFDYGIGGDGPVMGKDVNVSLVVVAVKQ